MNPALLSFAIALIIAQLALPKRFGFLPLIVAGCHLGNGELLGDLTIARLLIVVGLARAISGKFFVWSKTTTLDRLLLLFSVAALLSAFGHKPFPTNPWNSRLGLVLNVFGSYLYGRAYLPDLAAFRRFAYIVPLILVPLSVAMTLEKKSQRNLYYILGANSPNTMVREGKVRAQGPFRHPILAGCAGATILPFAYLLWLRGTRMRGLIGGAACLGVILACSSSGPLAAVAVTVLAALLWRWRENGLKFTRRVAIGFGLFYWVAAGKGPWYLMASMDLVGGSTGWHRAKLFDQGFRYVDEWWLCGSDYTRHWMASGVSWSPDHVDLTNYYLHLGVIGGLPLTISLLAILVVCFKTLGRRMAAMRASGDPAEIVLWCVGAALAAHSVSFVSVSYFDQMYIMFYTVVGAVPGLTAASHDTESPPAVEPVTIAPPAYV